MMSTRQQMFRDQEPGDLVASLKHSDIDVRWRAARILGAMGGLACDLLMKLLYDDDKGVRILAAWALGRTGDPRATDALMRACPDDDDLVQLAIDCAIERLLAGPSQ